MRTIRIWVYGFFTSKCGWSNSTCLSWSYHFREALRMSASVSTPKILHWVPQATLDVTPMQIYMMHINARERHCNYTVDIFECCINVTQCCYSAEQQIITQDDTYPSFPLHSFATWIRRVYAMHSAPICDDGFSILWFTVTSRPKRRSTSIGANITIDLHRMDYTCMQHANMIPNSITLRTFLRCDVQDCEFRV